MLSPAIFISTKAQKQQSTVIRFRTEIKKPRQAAHLSEFPSVGWWLMAWVVPIWSGWPMVLVPFYQHRCVSERLRRAKCMPQSFRPEWAEHCLWLDSVINIYSWMTCRLVLLHYPTRNQCATLWSLLYGSLSLTEFNVDLLLKLFIMLPAIDRSYQPIKNYSLWSRGRSLSMSMPLQWNFPKANKNYIMIHDLVISTFVHTYPEAEANYV